VIGVGTVKEVVIRVRISATKKCEEEGLEIIRRAARASEQIGMGL